MSAQQYNFDTEKVLVVHLLHEGGTKEYSMAILPCGTCVYGYGKVGSHGNCSKKSGGHKEFNKQLRAKRSSAKGYYEDHNTWISIQDFLNGSHQHIMPACSVNVASIINNKYQNISASSTQQEPVEVEDVQDLRISREEAYGDAFGAWS